MGILDIFPFQQGIFMKNILSVFKYVIFKESYQYIRKHGKTLSAIIENITVYEKARQLKIKPEFHDVNTDSLPQSFFLAASYDGNIFLWP